MEEKVEAKCPYCNKEWLCYSERHAARSLETHIHYKHQRMDVPPEVLEVLKCRKK